MNETKNRAMKAIGRYLELKGCEILQNGWTHGSDRADYIIEDGGELAIVFGHVHENVGEGIPDEAIDRKAFERLAAAFLAEHLIMKMLVEWLFQKSSQYRIIDIV